MKSNEFCFVAGIHGNEIAPLVALNQMGMAPIVGNPTALLQKKRFVEKDLNAAFNSDGNSLEERRAKELLDLIPKDSCVIDFHTFSCVSEPFAVIVDLKMLPIAIRTGVPHIVYMGFNIKNGHALINHRAGVSVEVGSHESNDALSTTKQVINSLNTNGIKPNYQLYEVQGIIEKPGSYVNFQEHAEGFIPILAGETAYDHFGLKAVKISAADYQNG